MIHYWRLLRPGLLATVLGAMTLAALTVGPRVPPWSAVVHRLIGTGLLIAGATAMNQRLERRADARMARTAGRPLPTQSLSPRHVTTLAAMVSTAAVVYLACLTTVATTALAALSWIVYVLIYTPLKRLSPWHTPVGALAGAIPMLLGADAAGGLFTPLAAVLFAIVFFWQFPHTMAIAWIYRQQYAGSGIKVAAVVDPSGRLAGRLAVLGAGGLLLVSLVPAVFLTAGWTFAAAATLLGLADLALAARFLHRRDDASARALWRASLLHLPALLLALLWVVRS